MLVGCEEGSPSELKEQTTEEVTLINEEPQLDYTIKNAKLAQFNLGEQEFEIVPFFEANLKYVQEAKLDEENYKQLFVSNVIEHFENEAFSSTEKIGLAEYYNFKAPINIDRLYESIKLLDEQYEKIIILIQEALEKSTNLLPNHENITIYLFLLILMIMLQVNNSVE